MRARLALLHCGAQYELREVVLKNKPAEMLDASEKGTVPVLVLPAHSHNTSPSRVIDESIDIMQWAMTENPKRHLQAAEQWLATETMSLQEINALIERNDCEFKDVLDKYKYSDRHPEHPREYYFAQAMPFLETLENRLSEADYLGGSQFRFADAALLPFIRQFSMVKPEQFNHVPLPKLQQWLAKGLETDLFLRVMKKVPPWHTGAGYQAVIYN